VNQYLVIALGAAVGANARYLVGVWAGNRFGAAFPYGTLIVNVTGSLMLGFVLALASARLDIPAPVRLFLAVGFLGSYTTFSSYTVESLNLLLAGSFWAGMINMVGNNLIGLVCAMAGLYLARLWS
jgi:CrcB protein